MNYCIIIIYKFFNDESCLYIYIHFPKNFICLYKIERYKNLKSNILY